MVSSLNTSQSDRDVARAASLVTEQLTREESADAFYRAAMVAENRKARIKLLQQALSVDPFHQEALEAWEASVAQKDNVSVDAQRAGILEGAIPIFEKHGWTLVVAMSRMAQFQRKKSIDVGWSFLMVALFSVFGLLAVLYRIKYAGKRHIHLQVGPNDTLTVLNGQNPRNVSTLEELENIARCNEDEQTLPIFALAFIALVMFALWIAIL